MHESTALVMLCTERKGIDSINQKNAVIFFRTTSAMFVDPFSTKGVLPKEILYFAHLWLLRGDSASYERKKFAISTLGSTPLLLPIDRVYDEEL